MFTDTVASQKMDKKSKKRKRRKISSSSSEDEKGSKRHDAAKSSKKKPDVTCQKRCSNAAEPEKRAIPAVADAPRSTRQIKKPVYRQKTVDKEEERTEVKRVSKQFHEGHCSSKAKNDISGKDKSVSGTETVARESSKPTNHAGRAPQRTGQTSKRSLGERSPQGIPYTSRRLLTSPSLVSAEEAKQAHHVPKKKFRAEEPPRTTRGDSNFAKTRKELVNEKCRRHSESKATTGLRNEASPPSVSTKANPKHCFTSATCTATVRSPKEVKDVIVVSTNAKSTSPSTDNSSLTHQKTCFRVSPLTPKFKIPKKVQPAPVVSSNVKNATCSHKSVKQMAKRSDSLASVGNNFKQETPQKTQSRLDVTQSFPAKGRDKRPSLSGQLPATSDTVTEPWFDQVQVVEELHLARSEKRLELNVTQSYGELTCMDIDPPEEGAPHTHCKQPQPQHDLILVLDTNILLTHLDYVKKMRSHGLGAMGFPVVLIPWMVLQELDSLKKSRIKGSVGHLATPAITYIYNSLKNREPDLWGQSMQQAAEGNNGLNAENNDDRVLQCCLQYQRLYPECAVILCTNDKNLCSKALLSGVRALSKTDLEAEVQRSTHGFQPLENMKTPTLPQISPQVSSSLSRSSCTSAQPHSEERTGRSVGLTHQDTSRLREGESEEKAKCLSGCVSEFEECLREVLSDVLQVEMKAIFEDIWLEIVFLKPPWTLQDVLRCLKKHWIAVFGEIVPRWQEQTVSNLIHFFHPGKTVNLKATLTALHEAKELVKAFEKRSRLVSRAIATMSNIVNKLQPKARKEKISTRLTVESPACDVVMNDGDDDDKEDKQLTSAHAQVSSQEVWALFDNIWSNVCQTSLEVFKALGFDPHTMQSAQPAGGPPPPQDALACLHRLSSVVSQLLQAFSSVLSSAPGLEEVQTLLSIIHSNEIVNVDSRLTARDLLDCFSQQEYREKLGFGGNQLMQLKVALECCVGTWSQQMSHTT